MPDEVMTNVTKSDALQHAEITALRQMGDAVQAVVRSLETITGKLDDVRERVIRLEAQKTASMVESLQTKLDAALSRVDALEAERDTQRGAKSVWEWLSKNAGWLIAAGATFIAGLMVKSGKLG